jgi:hypothetical protein
MKADPLQQAQKRAFQYWYVDGTFEFSFGGICLLLAAYFYVQFLLSAAGRSNFLVEMLLFLLVFLGGGLLVNRLVMSLKEHLTFPRTGYISFPRKTGAKRWGRIVLIAAISALVSSLMVIMLVNRPAGFDWVVMASGLIFGLVVMYLGFRTGLVRFFIHAAISIGVGVVFGFANLPENIGLMVFYGLLGLGLLLVGGFSLWMYLRQNPASKQETEDE